MNFNSFPQRKLKNEFSFECKVKKTLLLYPVLILNFCQNLSSRVYIPLTFKYDIEFFFQPSKIKHYY